MSVFIHLFIFVCFVSLCSYFLSRISCTDIYDSQDSRERVGEYLFKFSLPCPPASQTLRRQPGDYCKELTSTHSQQTISNRKPLVSERRSVTTELRAQRTHSFEFIQTLLSSFRVIQSYLGSFELNQGHLELILSSYRGDLVLQAHVSSFRLIGTHFD